MSETEKLSAIFNLLVDAALLALLLIAVWVAATRDPWAYVFWVPFLLFVFYMRVRQAGRRWAAQRSTGGL